MKKKIVILSILLIVFAVSLLPFFKTNARDIDEMNKEYGGSDLTSPEHLPPPVESPTSVIPYKFETGIPGIAKPGEELERMTLSELIVLLIRYIFRIAGILAFAMIVYGGIEYMISAGNAEKQKSAQQHIIGAVIGLVLLFAFWLILNTINPDILRTSSSFNINIENNTENDNNTENEPNSSPQTQTIAQNLLNGGDDFEILWEAAKRDLQDVVDNKCTSIYSNTDPAYRESNCIEEKGTIDKTTNTIHPYPSCPTIHEDLLVALDYLINEKFKEIKNGLPSTCNPKLLISPFLSSHNYCTNPAGSHKYGCSVDIAIDGENTKSCTQQLLKLLCPAVSNVNSCINSYTCTFSLGGIPIGIVNETNCAGVDPHLHFQARNCQYP